jgi:drug/metabolite transporter (DMT)-like permease
LTATAASSTFLVPVVLSAAFLHAAWNAILKFVHDKIIGMFLMSASSAVLAVGAIFLVHAPAHSSWALLVVSALLHVGYSVMLVKTFEMGDFNQVYPLARGLSPVLVAGAASVIGDPLSGRQTAGIAVVCGGLAVLVLSAGRPRHTQRKALWWAAATGLSIATYTVVDGVAVRCSGTAAGYTTWMMVIESWLIAVTCLAILSRRQLRAGSDLRTKLAAITPTDVLRGLVAGILSPLAYGLVLWAQTRGALAAVAALRETSVIFGAALGSLFLKEPFGRYRVFASIAIAGGILILEIA